MKTIISALLFVSSVSFAVDQIEAGTYVAKDVDSGTIVATLAFKNDKTVNFKVETPDFTMPEPGCNGVYAIKNNLLTAEVKCPVEELANLQVQIDITNVTPESVQSEPGAVVPVKVDAFGSDAINFYFKKVK